MPRVYRSMKRNGDVPLVGENRNCLGVKPGVPPDGDIEVVNGLVIPESGGMSVASDWRKLPSHRIPNRLRAFHPSATGSNQNYCWYFGDSDFVSGAISESLLLRVDRPNEHGLIEPAIAMTIESFQASLAATTAQWKTIPEDP